MFMDEQLAWRIAEDRMAEARCWSAARRALRVASARTSCRERLGRAVVRLGRWLAGNPPRDTASLAAGS